MNLDYQSEVCSQVVISETLNGELFMLIGTLHRDSSPKEAGIIRKASELYSLIHQLEPVKAASLALRRKKLELIQEELATLCRVATVTVIKWEQEGGPAWLGPLLNVLEERRRDQERRDYAGI